MEYMKIAVVTDDRAYGKAVCRSLLIGNRNFDLGLYGNADFCERWRQGGQMFRESFDLILWDCEGLEKVYGGNLVWLTERASQTGQASGRGSAVTGVASGQGAADSGGHVSRSGAEERFTIYKYSTSAAMVAAVFGIYGRLTGRRPAGARPARVEVFAFVSWQGGSGCTTLAMALGQELTRFYRKRVLYLSLEGTESTAQYMEVPDGMKTAGEYMYHLMDDAGPGGRPAAAGYRSGNGGSRTDVSGSRSGSRSGGTPFLEGYLVRDSFGMEAFAPGGSCNPVCTAGREEMRRLLPALMESGRFDVILLDAGCGTGEAVREALSFADRICLVSSREEPARETRYRAFLRYGVAADAADDLQRRLIRIRNRSDAAARSSAGGSSADARSSAGRGMIDIRGSRGKDSAGDARTRDAQAASGTRTIHIAERDNPGGPLLLEGTFGKDVHKLAKICYNKDVS